MCKTFILILNCAVLKHFDYLISCTSYRGAFAPKTVERFLLYHSHSTKRNRQTKQCSVSWMRVVPPIPSPLKHVWRGVTDLLPPLHTCFKHLGFGFWFCRSIDWGILELVQLRIFSSGFELGVVALLLFSNKNITFHLENTIAIKI